MATLAESNCRRAGRPAGTANRLVALYDRGAQHARAGPDLDDTILCCGQEASAIGTPATRANCRRVGGNAALDPRALIQYNETSIVAANEKRIAALAAATAATTQQQPVHIRGYEVIRQFGHLHRIATHIAPFVDLMIVAVNICSRYFLST